MVRRDYNLTSSLPILTGLYEGFGIRLRSTTSARPIKFYGTVASQI